MGVAVKRVKKQTSVARAPRGREPRAETRRRPVDRRLAFARAGYLLLALVFAVGLYQLLGSPALRVTHVEVAGNYLLSRDEIVQAAGVLNKNVFSIDKQRVADAVRRLGILRSVEVTTALPNAVTISVVENEPRYLWRTNEHDYLVDGDGVVLAKATGPSALPGLREVDGKARQRGDKVDLAALEAVARLETVWPERLGPSYACEYSSRGLTVVGDGWRAELGDAADIEAKVLSLTAIMDSVAESGDEVAFVDLRNAERPYFTLKQEQEE